MRISSPVLLAAGVALAPSIAAAAGAPSFRWNIVAVVEAQCAPPTLSAPQQAAGQQAALTLFHACNAAHQVELRAPAGVEIASVEGEGLRWRSGAPGVFFAQSGPFWGARVVQVRFAREARGRWRCGSRCGRSKPFASSRKLFFPGRASQSGKGGWRAPCSFRIGRASVSAPQKRLPPGRAGAGSV